MIRKLNINKDEFKILSVDFDVFYYLGENYFDVQCFDIDWSLTYIRYADLFSMVRIVFIIMNLNKLKQLLKIIHVLFILVKIIVM